MSSNYDRLDRFPPRAGYIILPAVKSSDLSVGDRDDAKTHLRLALDLYRSIGVDGEAHRVAAEFARLRAAEGEGEALALH